MASDSTATSATEVAGSGKVRAEKTRRIFIDSTGKEYNRARLDTVGLKIVFLEGGEPYGEPLTCDWAALTPEVQRAAGLFGILTSVTNVVGAAGMSADDMIEAATTRLETILKGSWSAERQPGMRTADLVEAAKRAFVEAGKPLSDEDLATMAKALADETNGPAYREKLLSRTKIAAHFAAIKSERALERLQKAKAKAANTSNDDLDGIL